MDIRLKPLVDAINRDVADLFIEPTLAKIQEIVRKHKDVEYAQVGKTSVASLNGIKSAVTSDTVSAFNEPEPLRLSNLLRDAAQINSSVKELLPGTSTDAVPAQTIISLLAAASKDTSRWRALTAGTSMDITPNILRNSTSAELKIDLTIGPPVAGTTQGENADNGEPKLRPLSRISQQKVTTSVYVNTLDIFALSTFNSQITKDGGRSYIPVIGTIWQGIFSGWGFFGDLFSWKNHPQNIHHQSIILTNSFIVPTAMGLAVVQPVNHRGDKFDQKCVNIQKYLQQHKRKIVAGQIEASCEHFKPKPVYSTGQSLLPVPKSP